MLGSKTLLRGWSKQKLREFQFRLSSKNEKDKGPNNICDKLAGKKPQTPKERQAIIDLDECATRKYVSPCKDLYKPCIPERLSPHPCTLRSSNLPRPDVECIFDPDCAYNRKSEFTLRLKQLLIAFGSSLLAYLFYKHFFFKEPKVVEVVKKKEKQCPFKKANDPVRVPEDAYDIPQEVPYLIIGGGTASHAAFKAIQEAEPTAKILVVSKEPFIPYMRPPLTKALFDPENADSENLQFKDHTGTVKSIYYEKPEFFIPCKKFEETEGGVSIAFGWDITALDVVKKEAQVGGRKIKYYKCLIATGAKPKPLDIVEEAEDDVKCRFTYFRGIEDYQVLNSVLTEAKSIAIVGGGFVGSELACSLKKKNNKLKVTLITNSEGMMTNVLPQYLANWTAEQIAKEGIEVITKSLVEDASLTEEGQLVLHVTGGKEIKVDHTVVAVGVEPVTDLAEKAGLEIDSINNGYCVNAEMQARDNLYIAGDCASFYDTKLGRRRVEHHQHAEITGKLAGENMAKGNGVYFKSQPMFWSGIGPLSLEAVGVVDSSLPTVGVFPKVDKDDKKTDEKSKQKTGDGKDDENVKEKIDGNDFSKGVIFYLKKNIIVGIVLWNMKNKIPIAKLVLDQRKQYEDIDELVKLLAIHETVEETKDAKEAKQDTAKGK